MVSDKLEYSCVLYNGSICNSKRQTCMDSNDYLKHFILHLVCRLLGIHGVPSNRTQQCKFVLFKNEILFYNNS